VSPPDSWNPGQYNRFGAERKKPFHDLLAMVEPLSGGRAVDLGCGTGELTRELHRDTKTRTTLGLDSSEAMLAESANFVAAGLQFEQGDITAFAPQEPFDLVFSNAALQWVANHEELFPRLTGFIVSGGQLAIQIPANHDHPSHLIAHELAAEEPYASALNGYVRVVPVLEPDWYAEMLHRAGFEKQAVRMNVYPHYLQSREDVVEWCKGTLLTDYQRRLPEEIFERYLSEYSARLLPVLDDSKPYFYAFKRILMWGRKRD